MSMFFVGPTVDANVRRSRRDQLVDLAISAALTALVVFQIWHGPITQIGDGPISGPKASLLLIGLAATVPLAIRRRWPLIAVTIITADGTLQPLMATKQFGSATLNLFEIFLAFMLIVYSTAANTTGRRTWIGGGIIIAILLFGGLPALANGSFSTLFGTYVFCGVAWVVGKTIQHRNELSERLASRAETLEQTRDAEVEKAVSDERSRMARELHDGVSHSVS